MRRLAWSLLLPLLVIFAPAAAEAHTVLSELILKLLLSETILAPPSRPFISHEAHFLPLRSR